MIRTLERRGYAEGLMLCKFAGNSSDSKPVNGLVTGSTFIEVDTGKEYLFDEFTGEWNATGSGNGRTSIEGATITLGSSLAYTGSELTQTVSTVKIGNTTLTADTDYKIVNNKATELGTYTLSVVGVGSYTGHEEKEFTISQGTGSVSASPASLTLTAEGDEGTSALTVTGDGEITVESSAAAVATASVSGTTVTVTPLTEGSATVTVTLAETDHFSGDTATISVTVEAAADDSEG